MSTGDQIRHKKGTDDALREEKVFVKDYPSNKKQKQSTTMKSE